MLFTTPGSLFAELSEELSGLKGEGEMNILDNALASLSPGWIGNLLGIVGLIAAGATYFLTRKRKILAYLVQGNWLLGSNGAELPKQVTVMFEGKDIPRLTRSRLIMWNKGEETIQGEDIVGSDPLRIDFDPDVRILSANILKTSRDVIGGVYTIAEVDKSSIAVEFEFLDKGDGFVLEILHTGIVRRPDLKGTIKGIPAGPCKMGGSSSESKGIINAILKSAIFGNRMAKIVLFILTCLSASFFFVSIFYPDLLHANVLSGAGASRNTDRLAAGITGGLYTLLGLQILWSKRRYYPKALEVQ